MWELDSEHCCRIPTTKSDLAIFTLTDYLRDPSADFEMIRQLRQSNTNLTFWPQGLMDLAYLRTLACGDFSDIQILDPHLDCYNNFLRTHECDYVGTRLHAGIKAMQYARRSLITGIDNRTASINADTGLPMLDRNKIGALANIISSPIVTNLLLPLKAIMLWRSQLVELSASVQR
jgi:hypothetical protein